MLQPSTMPSNAQHIETLLQCMETIVLAEIRTAGGRCERTYIVDRLCLKQPSYPLHADTQGATTWLAAILLSRMERSGIIRQLRSRGSFAADCAVVELVPQAQPVIGGAHG